MAPLSKYLLPLLGSFVFSQAAPVAPAYDYLSHARSSSDALMKWYNQGTGVFDGTGWWNSAECITALADMQGLDPTSNFLGTLENTFEINKNVWTTKSDFYDDEGWWALAWIKAYNCGGGIWWDKDSTYVNSIANGA
jgi:predicted alpha-1,6-mannanase (GH76 family)